MPTYKPDLCESAALRSQSLFSVAASFLDFPCERRRALSYSQEFRNKQRTRKVFAKLLDVLRLRPISVATRSHFLVREGGLPVVSWSSGRNEWVAASSTSLEMNELIFVSSRPLQ